MHKVEKFPLLLKNSEYKMENMTNTFSVQIVQFRSVTSLPICLNIDNDLNLPKL